MAIYIGLRQIAARMRWKSPQTVLRNYGSRNFPIIRRFLPNGRFVWITDDTLIMKWLEGQWHPAPVRAVVPRRHYEPCQRCGDLVLVLKQKQYPAGRTQRAIDRIASN